MAWSDESHDERVRIAMIVGGLAFTIIGTVGLCITIGLLSGAAWGLLAGSVMMALFGVLTLTAAG